MNTEPHLSRRERQIMDVLHTRQHATAAEVLAAIPHPPGYSAVRALLRILEDKGHVKHRRDGARYVYFPCVSRKAASRSALKRVLNTFFHGSVNEAVAALLDVSDIKRSEGELAELRKLIDKSRKQGR